MSDKFYQEFEPQKRKEILDASPESYSSAQRELFDLRYLQPKKGGFFSGIFKINSEAYSDGFLAAWIDIKVILSSQMGFITRMGDTRRITSALERLCIPRAAEFADALSNELEHMVRLYVHTCLTDRGYGSTAFGLAQLSDENIQAKLKADLKEVQESLPTYFKDESDYKPLISAIEKVLRDFA